MSSQPLDELGAPDDDPRLRPAEQLVAGEADEVGAGRNARPRGRLVPQVDERSGPEVVHEWEFVALSHLRELRQGRLLREADDAEVRLMDAQEEGGLGPDRGLVVRRARAVRR